MATTLQKRNTAFKVWISDLLNSAPVVSDGSPNSFRVNNKSVHRVNLTANVVFKFDTPDRSYCSLTVDDGSASIRLKSWREDTALLADVNVGDMVLVIGRPRIFNGETYITPELIKILSDPNWELVHKLMLLKEFGPASKISVSEEVDELSFDPPKPVVNSVVEEEIVEDVSETLRQKILSALESNSSDQGLEISKVVELSGLGESQVESIVHDLIMEGEIFEPRKGFLKVV